MSDLKISIITPSFNQGKFIEKNIKRVLAQNYPDFEHIVIDGGSSDDTKSILQKYGHLKWVSEKDKGQAHALNKGLAMATGEVIGWINADDYYEPDIFNFIAEQFKDAGVQWLVGTLNQVDAQSGKTLSVESKQISYEALLRDPDLVKQPCTFFRKSIIQKAGGLQEQFYMVLDYDLFLRISKFCEPKMCTKHLANFVIQPDQKTSLKNSRLQISEIISILKREKASAGVIAAIVIRKYRSIVKQIVKRSYRSVVKA